MKGREDQNQCVGLSGDLEPKFNLLDEFLTHKSDSDGFFSTTVLHGKNRVHHKIV